MSNEELQTDRLSLRRPAHLDVAAILAIHSDPRACAHNPSDALATREEAEELFDRWDDHWREFGFGYWVVRHQGGEKVLGFCGLKFMNLRQHRVLNLFYRFDPTDWGRGFAGEAATMVVRWAAEAEADHPVIARIRPANVASRRIAVRAGLVRAEYLDEEGFDGFDQIFVAPRHGDELRG